MLTYLHTARPAWLANAHADLDAAVAAAYGWPADLSDDGISKRLFDLYLTIDLSLTASPIAFVSRDDASFPQGG